MTEPTVTDTTVTNATASKSSAKGRAGHVSLWVLQVLGAAMFAFTGVLKVTGDPATVAGFEAMGLGVAGMYIVGVLEIAAAVGLLLPGVAGFAGLCLVALMVGATIATIATMGLSPLVALPAATLIVVTVIAWGRRHTTVKFANALLGR